MKILVNQKAESGKQPVVWLASGDPPDENHPGFQKQKNQDERLKMND
jgi:hypothetical protein